LRFQCRRGEVRQARGLKFGQPRVETQCDRAASGKHNQAGADDKLIRGDGGAVGPIQERRQREGHPAAELGPAAQLSGSEFLVLVIVGRFIHEDGTGAALNLRKLRMVTADASNTRTLAALGAPFQPSLPLSFPFTGPLRAASKPP
jgi:hypothetical protein